MREQDTKFQIFRGATAPTLEQTDVLHAEGITPDIREGLRGLRDAGIVDHTGRRGGWVVLDPLLRRYLAELR